MLAIISDLKRSRLSVPGAFAALLLAAAAPVGAEDSRRSEGRLSSSEETTAEVAFTWQRDAPYGELGFPGDQFGPHWEFLRLATHPPVQEELDLSPEQIERLETAKKRLMAAQGKWSRGHEHPDYLQKPYEEARRILTEEQALRIEQIKLQRRGVRAFLHADVQEAVDLDAEQMETIRKTWKEHVAKAQQGWKGDQGRRSYHQVWKTALETLSESQRHKFYQMTGPIVRVR
jgi:hypothetical protein